MWVPSLDREDSPGEDDNPLQYSCWEIPWTEEPGGLQSMRSQRDTAEQLSTNNTQQVLPLLPFVLVILVNHWKMVVPAERQETS